MEAWHFLSADYRLRFKPRRLVKVGRKITFKGAPILCEQGLHASVRAIDALQYAPGPIICRVLLGGEIVHGSDKVAAQERTVLWMADATDTLSRFACWCADNALNSAGVKDIGGDPSWNAIRVKLKWLDGNATDEELAAAWAAAWAAARDAAWAAARAAAWAAAWAAVRAAARAAARDARAARAAARDAALDAQNKHLESLFQKLAPVNV